MFIARDVILKVVSAERSEMISLHFAPDGAKSQAEIEGIVFT